MATRKNSIRRLDVVAVTVDLPKSQLRRGQVGTVVESLAGDAFEVEFSDDRGRTYAQVALKREHLLPLHYRPSKAA